MNAPARFEFKPAVRDRVALLIALAGASGSGKTLSALLMARGLADGDDSQIAVIDTEARRALHYAVAPGENPAANRFAFRHGELRAPFTPEAYADGIMAADESGAAVIVVDSVSHSWEGEGGLQEIHDDLVRAAVEKARENHNQNWGPFDESKAADKASVGAWREPKARNKRFVNRLLQCRAHLILCLRADEKIRIEKVKETGKGGKEYERTVIVQPKDMPPAERWVPICEKRFMYEMTLSLLLTPLDPGKPIPIKLQAQHRDAVPVDRPLSEQSGRDLAAWAKGGAANPAPAGPAGGAAADRGPSTEEASDFPGDAAETPDAATTRLEQIARDEGMVALGAAWGALGEGTRKSIGKHGLERLKEIAAGSAP
jgi:hypothetical protein